MQIRTISEELKKNMVRRYTSCPYPPAAAVRTGTARSEPEAARSVRRRFRRLCSAFSADRRADPPCQGTCRPENSGVHSGGETPLYCLFSVLHEYVRRPGASAGSVHGNNKASGNRGTLDRNPPGLSSGRNHPDAHRAFIDKTRMGRARAADDS